MPEYFRGLRPGPPRSSAWSPDRGRGNSCTPAGPRKRLDVHVRGRFASTGLSAPLEKWGRWGTCGFAFPASSNGRTEDFGSSYPRFESLRRNPVWLGPSGPGPRLSRLFDLYSTTTPCSKTVAAPWTRYRIEANPCVGTDVTGQAVRRARARFEPHTIGSSSLVATERRRRLAAGLAR